MIRAGQRFEVAEGVEALVRASPDSDADVVARLAPGDLLVVAELALEGERIRSVRLASPGGWAAPDILGDEAPARPPTLDRTTFLARHEEVVPGDFYGLPFPFSLEALRAAGPAFLTEAFRAAGTLASDNEVVAIRSIEPCHGGAASEKAFLTVDYARDEEGLERELFVKTSLGDAERKFYLATSVRAEVALGRLSAERALPVDVPRFYYGDHAERTHNFILITERVGFGAPPIAPVCEKGLDHHLPDARERYLVLARALARLVAAHKAGRLGPEFEATFPYPLGTRKQPLVRGASAKLDRLLTFVRDTAPQLFPEALVEASLLEGFRADVVFAFEHMDALFDALHAEVDYTGFCHPNLNLDNAWFWRDEEGALQAGLLDWGANGQMCVAQALVGMLMFPEPDGYPALLSEVVEVYVDELAARGGPRLRPDVLRRHCGIAQFSWALPTLLGIVVDTLDRFSDAEYATMADAFDVRLEETGLRAGIVWIAAVLWHWAEDETPGEAARALLAARG